MDISMTPAEIDEYLDRPLMARLAAVGRDGYPAVYPVWFIYEGGEIIASTMKGAPKTKKIEANPKVGFTVDSFGLDETKGVIIRGTAVIIEDDDKETSKKILLKYLGSEDDPVYQRTIEMPRVLIKIKPEKTYSWDYSKMGG